MGFVSRNYVEVSHLTYENANDFGITTAQATMLNDLLYKCKAEMHNYVLEHIFKDGWSGAKFKLTVSEAVKLITNLMNDIKFEFIEYDSDRWHAVKLKEVQHGLKKDYVDYGLNDF